MGITLHMATLMVAEALLLGLAFYAYLRWGRDLLRGSVPSSVGEAPEQPGENLEAHDSEAGARRLLEEEPELASLYERLGYSLEFEREGQAMLAQLKGNIQVAIPDLEAFRAALTAARERIRAATEKVQGSPGGVPDSSIDEALAERARDPLLLAVEAVASEAAGDHGAQGDTDIEARWVEILGRDPIDELLPVVEQMPFSRNGRVVWRTPMALELLHKKAAEPKRFLQCLQLLEGWVRGAKIPRSEEAKAAVLDASRRLRRVAEEEATYLVTPVKALEQRYSEWYLERRDPAFMAHRRILDGLLLSLVEQRREVAAEGKPTPEAARADRHRAADLAAEYCRHPWMESPRLAALLLAHLLVTEARRVFEAEGPRTLLGAVRDEVVAGRFDVDETVRRLRGLESDGCVVHSLTYRLLRHVAVHRQVLRSGPRRTPSALSA